VVLEYVTDRLVDNVSDEIVNGRPSVLVEQPLIKAQAKEYVRQSQERLIGEPVLQRLAAQQSDGGSKLLLVLLDGWRDDLHAEQGYGPGNAVNLLRPRRGDLRALDLGHLALRQAYLAGVEAQDTSLAGAHLSQVVLTEAFTFPLSVALSGDGAFLVAGTSAGEVWLWRVADRTPLLGLQGHMGPIHGVALSADGRLLASCSWDGTVRLWETEGGRLLASLEGHTGEVRSVAMTADGQLWSLRLVPDARAKSCADRMRRHAQDNRSQKGAVYRQDTRVVTKQPGESTEDEYQRRVSIAHEYQRRVSIAHEHQRRVSIAHEHQRRVSMSRTDHPPTGRCHAGGRVRRGSLRLQRSGVDDAAAAGPPAGATPKAVREGGAASRTTRRVVPDQDPSYSEPTRGAAGHGLSLDDDTLRREVLMIYEIRTYTLKPGNVAEYEKRYTDAIEVRSKYSQLYGVWHTEIGPLNQMVHIWAYESLQQRADIRAAASRDPSGKWPPNTNDLLVSQESDILIPIKGMHHHTGVQDLGGLYELRMYTYPAGAISEVVETFSAAYPGRHEVYPVGGIWTSDLGNLNRLYQLFPYKNWDHRDEVRGQLRKNHLWPPHGEARPVAQLVRHMVPAAFSPLR
jgi:hypothetical protein